MSIDLCLQYTRNLDEEKDNLRIKKNQKSLRNASSKAAACTFLICIVALSTAKNSNAIDLVMIHNSTVAGEAAQRAANAIACGAIITTCGQKITDPKTKVALISCGIALGWCGKYFLMGK